MSKSNETENLEHFYRGYKAAIDDIVDALKLSPYDVAGHVFDTIQSVSEDTLGSEEGPEEPGALGEAEEDE